jgi:hypothetical protein
MLLGCLICYSLMTAWCSCRLANEEGHANLADILHSYQKGSGQMMNAAKSTIFTVLIVIQVYEGGNEASHKYCHRSFK